MNYAGTEKQSLQYEYLSTGNLLDDAASRVTQVKAGATTVAVYKYLGAGQLVSQQLAEAGVTSSLRLGDGQLRPPGPLQPDREGPLDQGRRERG